MGTDPESRPAADVVRAEPDQDDEVAGWLLEAWAGGSSGYPTGWTGRPSFQTPATRGTPGR